MLTNPLNDRVQPTQTFGALNRLTVVLGHGYARQTPGQVMARRRIRFVICYIAFKTMISFRKHIKRGAHLLAPWPEDVKGGFWGKWCCCWMGSVWWEKARKRERELNPVRGCSQIMSTNNFDMTQLLCGHPATKWVITDCCRFTFGFLCSNAEEML